MNYATGARRTDPQPIATDRPPGARQPGETQAAYRGFLSYLEHGTVRAAAAALGRNRSVLERYSKRWRWPERVRKILAGHVSRWSDLVEYEESHNLDAAANFGELEDRKMHAFTEITGPKAERKLDGIFGDPAKFAPPELEKEVDDLLRSL